MGGVEADRPASLAHPAVAEYARLNALAARSEIEASMKRLSEVFGMTGGELAGQMASRLQSLGLPQAP